VADLFDEQSVGPDWRGYDADLVHDYIRTQVANRLERPLLGATFAERDFVDKLTGGSIERYIWHFSGVVALVVLLMGVIFYSLLGPAGPGLALAASTLPVAIWLIFRAVNPPYDAFKVQLSRSAKAGHKIIEDFVGEQRDRLGEFASETDYATKTGFALNTKNFATAMVDWSISRRAGQYLDGLASRAKVLHDQNGFSKWVVLVGNVVFGLLLFLLGFLVLMGAWLAPFWLDAVQPDNAHLFRFMDLGPVTLAVWPMAHAMVAIVTLGYLGLYHHRVWHQERRAVLTAMDALFYEGVALEPEDIESHIVRRPEEYFEHMQRVHRGEPDELDRLGLTVRPPRTFWTKELNKNDPTPGLMRRYRKLLDTLDRPRPNNQAADHDTPRLLARHAPPPPRGIWVP
jgi:hypothetical protein